MKYITQHPSEHRCDFPVFAAKTNDTVLGYNWGRHNGSIYQCEVCQKYWLLKWKFQSGRGNWQEVSSRKVTRILKQQQKLNGVV